jgi:hypothetical protein
MIHGAVGRPSAEQMKARAAAIDQLLAETTTKRENTA